MHATWPRNSGFVSVRPLKFPNPSSSPRSSHYSGMMRARVSTIIIDDMRAPRFHSTTCPFPGQDGGVYSARPLHGGRLEG